MNPLRHRFQDSARAIPTIAALLTLLVSGASLMPGGTLPVLVENLLKIRILTAIGLSLACLSLWLWTRRPFSPAYRIAAQSVGSLVFAIGLFGFIEQISAGHFRLASLLQGDIYPPSTGINWLAPQTALALTFLGLALVMLDRRIRRTFFLSEYCFFLVSAIAFATLLRYGYDKSFLSPDPSAKYRMKATTAVILLLLSWGGLCTAPRGGAMLVFLSPSPTARALRRLLLLVSLSLPLLGWAQLVQERRGWHPAEFGIALLVVSSLSVFVLAVLILGAGLIKAELLQRRAELQRQRRDAYFSATFQKAAVGLAHVATNGRFLLTNLRLTTMLGYSAKEFKTLRFQDISFAPDLKEDLRFFHAALEGNLTQYSTEKRYRHRDGHLVWAHITVTPMRGRDGKTKYFVTVLEDISEAKRITQELEAANRAKDHFLSIISHELRTPLTPVLAALTNTGPAGEPPDLSSPATIEMLRRNIEHEASIINDLLDLTRITSSSSPLKLELKPVDMHHLILEVFEELEGSFAKKKLDSSHRLDAESSFVMGDKTRLRQILLNLLDNAIKFTPEGGSILVSTKLGPHLSTPLLSPHHPSTPETTLITTISDTGEGIDPSQLHAIFNPFEQGIQSRHRGLGGLGLGLAIVKGFINAHNGKIIAQSPGVGAEFAFSLPLAERPAERPSPLPAMPLPRKKCTLLLIEDHTDTRLTLQRLLQRRGHHVKAVATTHEALRLAARQRFDLVISDIGLQGASGLDIPSSLESLGLKLPCIALSGFGSEEDSRKSLQAGFAIHLTKPVEMPTLDDAIHRLLDDRGRGSGEEKKLHS